MEFKNEFTIKNVNMTGDEFIERYSGLLRRAIHFAKLYAILSYDRCYELKRRITPFNEKNTTDEVRGKIEQCERMMRYYKNYIKEIERLQSMEAKSETLNDKIEIMKMFDNVFNEWVLSGY